MSPPRIWSCVATTRTLAAGEEVELDAGAAYLVTDQELLDDAAAVEQVVEVPRRERRHRRPQLRRVRVALPDGPFSSTTAFPSPAPLSSCLTTTAATSGRSDRIRVAASTTSSTVRTPSTPTGTGTPVRRNRHRPAALNASDRSAGVVPLIGRPRASATAISWSVTFHGSMTATRPATHLAELVEEVRAVEELRGEGAGPEVVDDDEVQPLPHPVGDGGRDDVVVGRERLRRRFARAHEHEVAVDRG